MTAPHRYAELSLLPIICSGIWDSKSLLGDDVAALILRHLLEMAFRTLRVKAAQQAQNRWSCHSFWLSRWWDPELFYVVEFDKTSIEEKSAYPKLQSAAPVSHFMIAAAELVKQVQPGLVRRITDSSIVTSILMMARLMLLPGRLRLDTGNYGVSFEDLPVHCWDCARSAWAPRRNCFWERLIDTKLLSSAELR